MAIPTYDQFVLPLLKCLGKESNGLRSRDAYAALARDVGLSEEEQSELLPSGRQRVFQNRIGWANDRLKRARLSESASRGLWRITPKGRELLDAHPNGVPDEQVRAICDVARHSSVRTTDQTNGPTETDSLRDWPVEKRSPEERIDSSVRELQESLADELSEMIATSSPIFFERLVV